MKRLVALVILCSLFVILYTSTKAQWEGAEVQRLTYNSSPNEVKGFYIDENDELLLAYQQWWFDSLDWTYRETLFVVSKEKNGEWGQPEVIGNPSYDDLVRYQGGIVGYDSDTRQIHIFYGGGTSCSAPFVSGVAALVSACYPESSNAAIRTALINSADGIYGIPGNYPYNGKLGSGRANAYEAVKYYGAQPRPSGDCNGDRLVDVADIVFLVNYVLCGGQPPRPVCIADVTDNGVIDTGDIIYLVSYVHLGGAPPKDGCD
jgi:subtilisin family serine protease